VKAKSSTKQVSKCPHVFACILCLLGMCRGLYSSSELCERKSFTSMQLNQDNCANGAVDTAFTSKKVKLLVRFILVFSRAG